MSVVYPVPGHTLNCAPQVPLETDAATATRLVRTGAYTRTAPSGPKAEPEPYSADERLDFYDNPRGNDHDKVVHSKTEGSSPEGPSDSTPEKPEE
jgi:hypothetical protein